MCRVKCLTKLCCNRIAAGRSNSICCGFVVLLAKIVLQELILRFNYTALLSDSFIRGFMVVALGATARFVGL